MPQLSGKNMVVIGGSGGVGRRIVEFGVREGARVLAVARNEMPLRRLVQEVDGAEAMAIDATDEGAPAKVFDTLRPDILVVSAGAFPPAGPLHEQSWEEFAVNWQSDVKIAFHFFKAALRRPLPAGASIVLIASGAGLVGSPNSGGYAGAKRTQLFMANYSQKERIPIGSGLACGSWRWRHASCPDNRSSGKTLCGKWPAIRAILAYRLQRTSCRAWLRRPAHRMLRPRL